MLNVDMSEGIILRDPDEEDAEVAESEEQVEGVFARSKEDGEERKKILRDSLRRSLSHKNTSTPLNASRLWLASTHELKLDSSLRQTQTDRSPLDINEVSYSPGTCRSINLCH